MRMTSDMRRIALVSRDYNCLDGSGRWDFTEYFEAINRRCDAEGCDTILYSPFTIAGTTVAPRGKRSVFGGLTHLRHLVVEVGDLKRAWNEGDIGYLTIEVWSNTGSKPNRFQQQFATSEAPIAPSRHSWTDWRSGVSTTQW